MGLVLVFYFIALVSFVSGILIAFSRDEQARRAGGYLIMLSIILVIINLFIYSAGNYRL